MSEASKYVIWSEEHGAWWKPGGMGYTRSLARAGRYLRTDAEEIVRKANRFLHQDAGLPYNEVAVPDPLQAPREPTKEEMDAVAKATTREELAAALRAIDPRILAEAGLV